MGFVEREKEQRESIEKQKIADDRRVKKAKQQQEELEGKNDLKVNYNYTEEEFVSAMHKVIALQSLICRYRFAIALFGFLKALCICFVVNYDYTEEDFVSAMHEVIALLYNRFGVFGVAFRSFPDRFAIVLFASFIIALQTPSITLPLLCCES
jgi:hypothetical protein